MKKVIVVLTKKEYVALSMIIENGWGDGDFKGYGGENPQTQKRALKKFGIAPRINKNLIIARKQEYD